MTACCGVVQYVWVDGVGCDAVQCVAVMGSRRVLNRSAQVMVCCGEGEEVAIALPGSCVRRSCMWLPLGEHALCPSVVVCVSNIVTLNTPLRWICLAAAYPADVSDMYLSSTMTGHSYSHTSGSFGNRTSNSLHDTHASARCPQDFDTLFLSCCRCAV